MGNKRGDAEMNPMFALIGAAGYVAPRHMAAIKAVGGELVAALDPHDSVGVLDSYFPGCSFFTEFERFDRFISQNPVDYISICSPNYLHDAHCRFAMRSGADAICEKPLVLNERNLDGLLEIERQTGKKINTVLQLRLHPEVEKLKKAINGGMNTVSIRYVAPRGQWYKYSWKGNEEKSGGLATNIGIHLFDLLYYLFGATIDLIVIKKTSLVLKCLIYTETAVIRVYLSTIGEVERVFQVNDVNVDLSNGFADLHQKTYENVLAGNGFSIEDIRYATRDAEAIRG